MPDAERCRYSIRGQIFQAPHAVPGLYIVSTPIGNLGDITLRALETLAGCDLVACEDTRTSGVLLARYGIDRPKTSYTEHNAREKGASLVRRMLDGAAVALISDAGTPLVSDPGARLVKAALQAGIPVIPVPGASAPLAALAVSGLPTDTFQFCGFLPPRQTARRKYLEKCAGEPATLVFFESPKRLAAALADMVSIFGQDRPAVVARELTKMHETHYRATLGALADEFSGSGPPKGEIVIVVGGAVAKPPTMEEADEVLRGFLARLPAGKAASEAARQTGLPRRDLYARALVLKAT